MGRRTLLLLAALVVAGVGTALVFVYASSANARALHGQHPVEVLVAKTRIPVGTSALQATQKGMFEKKTIARAAATPGALAPTALATLDGKVALADIYPGEQILPVKFGIAAQTSGLPIPPGLMAVSVQLGDPARVAGFVAPGSVVAVFATLSPSGGTGGTSTRLLLPKALVVGVGPTTVGSTPANANPEQQLPRTVLTVALAQKDAQKLVFAAQQGQVYLALLTTSSVVTPDLGITRQNLFN
jgi:pilus assembly protein CpaB